MLVLVFVLVCVCVCVRASVRACVRACVCELILTMQVQRLTWWSRNSQDPCWDINEWSRDPEAYVAKMAERQTEATSADAGSNGHQPRRFDDAKLASGDIEATELKLMTKAEDGELVAIHSLGEVEDPWKDKQTDADQASGNVVVIEENEESYNGMLFR